MLRNSTPSSILRLFFRGCPAAIRRAVIPVIIYAFNAMLFLLRAQAHVGQEFFKVMPIWANKNSTSSVIFKRTMSRIFTSPEHGAPAIVLRRITASASTMQESSDTSCAMFQTQTPTTPAFARNQRTFLNSRYIAAITAAYPISAFIFTCCLTNYEKAFKFLTDDVFQWHVLNLQRRCCYCKV